MSFEVFTNYLPPELFAYMRSKCEGLPLKVTAKGDEHYIDSDFQETLEKVQQSKDDFRYIYKRSDSTAVPEDVKQLLNLDIVTCFVSCYVPGSFLTAHRDGCKGDKAFIFYLNDVPVEDGGALVIDGVHRVQPRANMMVVLDTGMLHEVIPLLQGERWAVAGWFNCTD
jgi:Rps23 Pro-64 3,4-dihydroxylase Tpa1-like proline 4-hydroxylase